MWAMPHAITAIPARAQRGPRGLRALSCVAVGCAALASGCLVYGTGRIPFGPLGQWLPDFVHPLAFSLFTAAVLKSGAAARGAVCGSWCAIDLAFEIGQHPALEPRWMQILHARGTDAPGTRAVLDYFIHGTFDPLDVLAIVLGTLAAVALLYLIDRRESPHA